MKMTLTIMAFTVAMLTGCTLDKQRDDVVITDQSGTELETGNLPIEDDKEKLVTKDYDIKDFTGLDVGYVTEVVYTQGKDYKVEVKATEEVFKHLQVNNSMGTLTLSFPQRTPQHIKNTKVYLAVSAPVINSFDLSGVSNLSSKRIDAQNLDIDISGTSKLNITKVVCNKADIDCSGVSKIDADIEAKEVVMECSGAGHANAQIHASSISVDISGAFKGQLDMKGDDADLEVSGASKIVSSFVGKRIGLDCSGTGKIELDVDCEQLEAENSGVAKVKISGTADKVKVEASGVSKIDTSRLNQL